MTPWDGGGRRAESWQRDLVCYNAASTEGYEKVVENLPGRGRGGECLRWKFWQCTTGGIIGWPREGGGDFAGQGRKGDIMTG